MKKFATFSGLAFLWALIAVSFAPEAKAVGEIPCDQQAPALAREVARSQVGHIYPQYAVTQVSVLRENLGGNADTFATTFVFRAHMPSNNDAYSMQITIKYSEFLAQGNSDYMCFLDSLQVLGAG